MYEMKPEYFVGIEMIDREHTQLFAYASEVYELLHSEWKSDQYDEIVAVLMKLREYTKEHFSDEEAYMESIHYNKTLVQKVQHQAFIEKLDEYDFDVIDENQEEVISELLQFLTDWLVNHIMIVDMQLKDE